MCKKAQLTEDLLLVEKFVFKWIFMIITIPIKTGIYSTVCFPYFVFTFCLRIMYMSFILKKRFLSKKKIWKNGVFPLSVDFNYFLKNDASSSSKKSSRRSSETARCRQLKYYCSSDTSGSVFSRLLGLRESF